MKNLTGKNSSDKILEIATTVVQAHGYNGLNVRELAEKVGMKAASLYHHFPSKADLAAAVAKRYWENSEMTLNAILSEQKDALSCLREYPKTFRISLECENRLCLSSFMTTEVDGLPEVVKKEVQTFADVNIAWLGKLLIDANIVSPGEEQIRAHAIFAAIAGAQLLARGRANIGLFDSLIQTYKSTGLLPA
jgi:TetR/AcrR family transcriptional regulator, transcriptional repressor for nem operon